MLLRLNFLPSSPEAAFFYVTVCVCVCLSVSHNCGEEIELGVQLGMNAMLLLLLFLSASASSEHGQLEFLVRNLALSHSLSLAFPRSFLVLDFRVCFEVHERAHSWPAFGYSWMLVLLSFEMYSAFIYH